MAKQNENSEKHPIYTGYSLLLMSESSVLEKNKLYVKIEKDKLQYEVIAPSGDAEKGEISVAELSINELTTLENLKPLLPDILKITSKRGHTLTNTERNISFFSSHSEENKDEKFLTKPTQKEMQTIIEILASDEEIKSLEQQKLLAEQTILKTFKAADPVRRTRNFK